MRVKRCRDQVRGFAIADALAMVTTAALLIVLFLSTAAGTRSTSESVACRSHLRQLGQAWQAYALDHEDRVIGTSVGADAQAVGVAVDQEWWATGWLTWDTSSANTNQAVLQVPSFVPYVGRNPRIFRCPSDRFVSGPQRQRGWAARARSYSMNSQFGPTRSELSPLRRFRKLADVPDPAGFFTLVEEHPDSINDPTFITTLGNTGWVDMPAANHERAANFPFADTHVETRRWVSERTILPVRMVFSGLPNVNASDPDFGWLLERTSVKGP